MTNIRRVAEGLLVRHKQYKAPIDPETMAEAEGVDVRFVEFSGDATDVVHGYYDAETPAIFVNSADTPEEKQFTIAHELGHHFLHGAYSASEGYVPRLKIEVVSKEEQEADEFARALLVPKAVFEQYSESVSDDVLKAMFLISEDVLQKVRQREAAEK